MSRIPQPNELQLDAALADALELVISRNIKSVMHALGAARTTASVCAVCLWHQQDESLQVPDLLVIRETQRKRLLSQLDDLQEDWVELWSPSIYEEEEELEVAEDESAEFDAARQQVLDGLEQQLLDVPRWVMVQAAQRLNVQTMPLRTTEDFVVFVADEELGDELVTELEHLASSSTLDSLRARGLIGRRER